MVTCVSEQVKREMAQRYSTGMTISAIAKVYRVSHGTVGNCLQELGVKRRPRGYTAYRKVDHRFFKSIGSESKAYWLGFLAADGNVLIRGHHYRVALALSVKDRDHLLRFRTALGSDHPVYARKDKPEVSIQIQSRQMVKDLASNGIVPCKSLTLQPPTTVPDELLGHYVRGCWDGDGSVMCYQRTGQKGYSNGIQNMAAANFIGAEDFVFWLAEWIEQKTGVLRVPLKHPGAPCFRVDYNGRFQTEKVLCPLYETATVYLPRKRDKYLEIVALNDRLGR